MPVNLEMQVPPDTLEMAGQAYLELSEKTGFNPDGKIFFNGGLRNVRAGSAPCRSPDCPCCGVGRARPTYHSGWRTIP